MNPYLIEGPTLYSFSGGRTSAYLLKHCIDAHGGKLPDDHVVTFANTGKEVPETLDFVQECGERWNVPIVWLEYDPEAEHQTRIVNHNSASRAGEPFEALIGKRKFLPNPVMRFCTTELKIRRMAMFAQKHMGWTSWNSVVGLRADEMHRVERAAERNAKKKDPWTSVTPLAAAGVTKQKVLDWFSDQPFDLRLTVDSEGDTILGNCDLCLAGETEVVTSKGIFPIRDLAGTSPELLVPIKASTGHLSEIGHFVEAPVRHRRSRRRRSGVVWLP